MCKTAGLVFICTAELTVHGILLAQRAIMIPVKSQNPVCNLDDLRTIQFLDGIDNRRLEALREHLCLVEHEQDDVSLHQGEATEALYFLLSGQVAVILKEEDGKQHSLAELNSDDTLGEHALLTGELHTAEVIANTSVQALQLKQDAFDAMLRHYPEIHANLCFKLARQLTRICRIGHRVLMLLTCIGFLVVM